jgi:hypothetical protein
LRSPPWAAASNFPSISGMKAVLIGTRVQLQGGARIRVAVAPSLEGASMRVDSWIESELSMNGVGKAQRAGIDVDVFQDDQFAGDSVTEIRGGNEEYRRGQQPSEPSDDCS